MPRHARFMLAGTTVHLVQRGNNRGACFHTDEDNALYLLLLGRLAPRFGCEVHAFCLMGNHVHLLVTPRAADSCGQLMKNLGQRYVQYFNRSHDRSGTLWEGRFRSCLVDSETYLLACHRYIELNPVRAGMVARPGDYRWSSYHHNVEGKPSSLLTPHPEYLRLGSSAAERRDAYRAMFAECLDARQLGDIRDATNGGFVLGSRPFQDRISQALGRRVARAVAGRPHKGAGSAQVLRPLLD